MMDAMRIVMAGSSGFLGTNLRRRLAADGHEVIRLVRRDPSNLEERRWRPELGELHPGTLAGADAVINLAGAPVARRWTAAYKEQVRSSRVRAAQTIASAIAAVPAGERPRTLLSASGVHYYGDTGDTAVDEESPAGTGFMPELCVDWEAATRPAEEAGVRVVHFRTGLVLGREATIMRVLTLVFNAGLGGPIHGGRYWMPWISVRDWAAGVAFLLDHDDVSGPVNLTGPNPARNADFSRALGRVMHRPSLFPTPRFGVRLVMGEFGASITDSIRALPAVLNRSGFTFADTDLDQALRLALGKS
jgi:uncharacterized protein (TIGR01777 family)